MRTKVFLALFLVLLLTAGVASQAEFADLSYHLRIEAANNSQEMITGVNYQPDFSQIDFSLAQEEPRLPVQLQQEQKEGLLPNNPHLRYP